MISCNLKGGLGNYMFQIAASVAYGLEHNKESVFSFKSAQQMHGNALSYKNNLFRKLKEGPLMGDAIYYEPSFSYTKIPPCKKNLLLDGYFQSELYFMDYEEQIRNIFSEPHHVKSYLDNKYGKSLGGSPCSVHVRRGDYITNPRHPTQSVEYYSQCMEEIGGPFLVFSDDIEWCRENFKVDQITFIDGEEDYMDLFLMGRCNSNIIANSSFSWWGAWLNPNREKTVIAPATWFEGGLEGCDTSTLLPKEWHRR